jgi:triacylglycerol esterase/lipase EstA (alpha/beta hydrolase family)
VKAVTHVRVSLKHSCFRDLEDNSFALLTERPEPQRAVVFVHGFGGNPSGTWSQMPRYIENDDGWNDTDAYFVGYRSTGDEVMLSADYLVSFIETILPQPPMRVFRVNVPKSDKTFLIRSESPRYSSVDFIGHSLGGVVMPITAWMEIITAEAATGDIVVYWKGFQHWKCFQVL